MLSGAQFQQLQAALLDACNESALRQLVRFELNADLDAVAGGRDLTERTHNLIAWADREGRLLDLVQGAVRRVPGNSLLQKLADEAAQWHLEPPSVGEEPYKGLNFFDVQDAALFFGREQLIAELVAYLRQHHFLAVVGASGSGKSSLVRAGLVPALAQGAALADGTRPPPGSVQWPVHILTPTAQPLKALATSLTSGESAAATLTLLDELAQDPRILDVRVSKVLAQTGDAKQLLLVVDQFEELFTLCKDRDERKAFVDNLLTASSPQGSTRVVITLRADFYAQCSEFDALREALTRQQKYIGPMQPEELRRAIEEPARLGGWQLESGLVDQMLRDIGDEPGALPLLSHALLETWKRRNGRMLTFAGYSESGRVQGAIAKTAERVLSEQLRLPEEQRITRNIFLRLTELGEGAQDTRRRVDLDELIPRPEEKVLVESVLKILADARLITTFQAGAEVAHEALIREWPRLREWLAENREWLRLQRRLTEAAQEWQDKGCHPDLLYSRTVLEQTEEKAAGHENELTALEADFLQASRAALELAEKKKKSQTRNTRLALAGVSLLLILTLVAGVVAFRYLSDDLRKGRAVSLIDKAGQDKAAGKVQEAIDQLFVAATAYPTLLPPDKLASEIEDVKAVAASQLVQRGETLLGAAQLSNDPLQRQQGVISATALFSQALALEPPSYAEVYVWIAPGEFVMGSGEADDLAGSDEKPQRSFDLAGFWIMRTEVTNAQYKRCVAVGKCTEPNNSHWDKPEQARRPVTDVDWNQARIYAEWVGGRLPSEAEWEKACRGTAGGIYPWGNEELTAERLNYYASGLGTTDIGSYPAGANELYDMAGNVWEWTSSLNKEYPYIANDGREDPTADGYRTLRGGSWNNHGHDVRCAYRFNLAPGDRNYIVGFRVVSPGF